MRSTSEPVGTGTRTAKPLELAGELRHDEPDRLRGAGRRRHEVRRRSAGATVVLVRPVEQLLVAGVRVHRGHHARGGCRAPRAAPSRPARGSSSCTTRSRRCGASSGSYVSKLTPSATVTSGSLAGAETITFFAPASRCFAASARLRKRPRRLDHDVDAERRPRAARTGSASIGVTIRLPSTTIAPSVASTVPAKRPVDGVVLEQLGEHRRIGDVVDRDPVDVGAGLVARPGTRRDRSARSR